MPSSLSPGLRCFSHCSAVWICCAFRLRNVGATPPCRPFFLPLLFSVHLLPLGCPFLRFPEPLSVLVLFCHCLALTLFHGFQSRRPVAAGVWVGTLLGLGWAAFSTWLQTSVAGANAGRLTGALWRCFGAPALAGPGIWPPWQAPGTESAFPCL